MLWKYYIFGLLKVVESNLIVIVVDKCCIIWIVVKDIYFICVLIIKVKFCGDIIICDYIICFCEYGGCLLC